MLRDTGVVLVEGGKLYKINETGTLWEPITTELTSIIASVADHGKVLRINVAGQVSPSALTTRGPVIAELSVPTDYTFEDIFVFDAPPLDQAWVLGSPVPGTSIATLNLLGTASPNAQVLNMPLAVPERWNGIWVVSKIVQQRD